MPYWFCLAALWALWPLAAFAGGAAFSPLVFLAGVAAVFAARAPGIRAYALTAGLFVVWAGVSLAWSPAAKTLMEGSIAGGDFSVEAAPIRLALTALAGALVASATLSIAGKRVGTVQHVMIGAITAQGVALLAVALFFEETLALFAPISDPVHSAPQNIIRNANLFALALPLLVGLFWKGLSAWSARAAVLLILPLAAWGFQQVDAQGAIAALLLGGACASVLYLLPRNGFRVLFSGAAASLLTAPLSMRPMIGVLEGHADALPESFRLRLWSWQATLDRIYEKPFFGHGLEASKEWRELYGSRPDLLAQLPERYSSYPIVPGHPHSFPLQVWAETGFVGAAIGAVALLLLGLRLPAPEALAPGGRAAVGGMIGAGGMLALVSYSAWNEAFWAATAIAAAGAILIARKPAA